MVVGRVGRDNVMRSSIDNGSNSVVGSIGPSIAVWKVSYAAVEKAGSSDCYGDDEGKDELQSK